MAGRRFQQSHINPENVGIDYLSAVSNIDLTERKLDGIIISLKPHQISCLAWMIRQEEEHLGM